MFAYKCFGWRVLNDDIMMTSDKQQQQQQQQQENNDEQEELSKKRTRYIRTTAKIKKLQEKIATTYIQKTSSLSTCRRTLSSK